MRTFFATFLFSIFTFSASSQTVALVPGASFGYTFGAGINYGVELGCTFYSLSEIEANATTGLELGYHVFHGKSILNMEGRFKVLSANLLLTDHEMYKIKLGGAKTILKWGANNVNKTESNGIGLNIDLSYSPPQSNIPWVGYRFFHIKNPCFGIRLKYVNTLYLAGRYPIGLGPTKMAE